MMKRRDLMLRLGRTLMRRRSALQEVLAGNAKLIAAGDCAVGDSVDAAADCQQDELDCQLAAVESRELAATDAALDRIRNGRYGSCDRCGRPIPLARLQALPNATLCIRCQREEEQLDRSRNAPFHWQRVADEPSEVEANFSTVMQLDRA